MKTSIFFDGIFFCQKIIKLQYVRDMILNLGIGYLMSLGHATLEENRRRKNKDRSMDKRTSNVVAGCDLGDVWYDVGESWGDGCSEPRCECSQDGTIGCYMYSGGCK